MHETLIDGIPAFLVEGPVPTTVGLVFGVGRADETFVRGGLTHLVEHLVMSAVGRTAYDSNASVDLNRTEFTASGTPEQVRDFLTRVCRALGDLPVDRLRVEADVLRTEGAAAAPPAVGILLAERYGTEGPGLAGVREPAIRSLTAEDVQGWVRTWFTRQNAALWLSGPVPERLVLPLTEGAPPARRPLRRAEVPTPGWLETPMEGAVALGGELPPGVAGPMTLELLRRRLEDELRHRRGVAYAVGADRFALDAETRFGVVVTDVRPGQEDLVVRVLWREVQRLADEGPTAEELEVERRTILADLDDGRGDAGEAASLAEARVTGVPAYDRVELRRQLSGVTTAEIRQTAARLRNGALLAVPGPLDPDPAGVPRIPGWSRDAVQGRTFRRRRRRTGVPKGATLVVGDDGVSAVLEEGAITVRWADAVGLVRQGPGEYQLLGRDGFALPLSAADWRDGEEAVALVRAAVPDELQVDDDDVEETAGLLLIRSPEHRVREAIAMSDHGATVIANAEWTAVVADDAPDFLVRQAELTAAPGRSPVSLVLRQTHADLEYVLYRGYKEIARHRWGIAPADPRLLAEAVQRAEESVSRLHRAGGTPRDIAEEAVAALGLPPQVPALLAGEPAVGGQRVEGAGAFGGFKASLRGDFVPEQGKRTRLERYQRLAHRRPPWFRALNAAGVLVYGLLVWGLVSWREHLDGWQFWLLLALCGASLLNAVWDARPLRRPAGTDPAGTGPAPSEPGRTPTG
ncbi:insulinase family protein [Blastococcus goldschmidtiae]|uniref:Insulinase family protein n=1 Tax=Blastococcus goldschmidtiae TaxID=3075546 RepID=A0ABU2KAS4_9ACTN|nr:insulinase family protein [Blastococcus sp. DSM 46792]MDT0277289.1 insulinase family protein [Blastococcus sp. DSM 46792]